MLIFGIAVGKPPAPISKIVGSFQGSFWEDFEHFFADAAKLKKMQPFPAKCLVWEVLGLRFCIFFAYFLNVFFMLLSRWTFCAILADSGLKGSPFGSRFSQIFQILHAKMTCWI